MSIRQPRIHFLLPILLAGGLVSPSFSQDWTGTTSQNWSTPSNWSPVGSPGIDSQAFINIATGSFPIISTVVDKSATNPGNDLWIGDAGNDGRLDINAGGSLDTSGTWIFLGQDGGSTGFLNVNSGGTITSNNDIRVGDNGAVGHLTVDGGTVDVDSISNSNPGSNTFRFANGANVTTNDDTALTNLTLDSLTGNVSLAGTPSFADTTSTISGGTFTSAGEIFIGNGSGSNATVTISSGTLDANNWLAVGRDGSTGVLNISGGVVYPSSGDTGQFLTIGSDLGAGPGSGTINHTAGSLEAPGIWLAEGGTSTADYNLSGTGSVNAAYLSVGANASATGTLTMTGGTLTLDGLGNSNGAADAGSGAGLQIGPNGGTGVANLNGGDLYTVDILGGSGPGTINLGGTSIYALADSSQFFSGGNLNPVNLNATTVIDTQGNDVSGTAQFTGTGGLTKQGAGTLTLAGDEHDFTGPISVAGGSLIVGAGGTDRITGDVTISNGADFGVRTPDSGEWIAPDDLNFAPASCSLTIDYIDAGGLVPAAPIRPQGTLNLSGTITVNVSGLNLPNGTYTLIDYSGATKSGSASWVVGDIGGAHSTGITDTGSAIQIDIADAPPPPPPVLELRHRYSFDTDATDSVGSANGTPNGGVSFSGGEAVFTGSNAQNIELSGQIGVGTVYADTGITIESWYTDNTSATFAKLFGFGATNEGQFFGYTHFHAGPGSAMIDLPSAGAAGNAPFTRPSTATEHHLVIAVAPDGTTNAWVDGVQVVTDFLNAQTNALSNVGGGVEQIGNSAWGDPSHLGTINEFRIWLGLFDSDNVAASYASGPDTVGAYPDLDGDGLPNLWEEANGLDPDDATGDNGASGDPDEDDSDNLSEYQNGTDPQDPDSDDDGRMDGHESNTGTWVSTTDTGTDPLDPDTDGDTLNDGIETNTGSWAGTTDRGTDPLDPDTDDDSLSDGVETNTGTYVSASDTGTDPHDPDSDGDGFVDGVEVNGGSDPNDDQSEPDSGLEAPRAFSAYSGGVFPPSAPGTGSAYDVEDAFPLLPNIDQPMFMLPYPDSNDLLVIRKPGEIIRFDNDPAVNSFGTPFLDIQARVYTSSDSGMTGMVFHPDFNHPTTPQRYVYITYKWEPRASVANGGAGVTGGNGDYAYWRLSRFDVTGADVADPDSELVLVQQFDPQQWHDAGCLMFGPEGYLYFSVGDGGGGYNQYDLAQKIDDQLFSGVFRIDVDNNAATSHAIRRQPVQSPLIPGTWGVSSYTANYMIPDDNPFLDAGGAYLEEYYALGLRQPYRFSQDPVTGHIWIGESGQNDREEVNILEAGANYQWPYREGDLTQAQVPGLSAPPATIIGTEKSALWSYDRSVGGCLIGGYVYRGTRLPGLVGRYLAAENTGSGEIYAVDWSDSGGQPVLDGWEVIANLGGGTVYGGASSCAVDQNGEVYFLKFGGTGGQRIWQLVATETVPEPPAKLSETGLFTDTVSLTPAPGLIPYTLDAPLWSDRALKFRWLGVPNDGSYDTPGEKISFDATGNWSFPDGTVTVKHFELPLDDTDPNDTTRLETRVVVTTGGGGKYAVTYQWNTTQSDANLMTFSDTATYTINEGTAEEYEQEWYFPSRTDCLACHTEASGQALGVRTQHFNTDYLYPSTGKTANQLATLNALGVLDQVLTDSEIADMLQARSLDDETAPLSTRLRSYMDSNCSHCHRPGAGIPGLDLRMTTPLAQQGIINGQPGQFGLLGPDSRYIVPGDVPLSIIHHRMFEVGNGAAMPPLAKNLQDEPAVQRMVEWINSLSASEFAVTDGDNPVHSELAGPSGVVNGPFDVTLALSYASSDMDGGDFATTGALVSALRGAGDYFVATVDPTGDPTASVRLPADSLTGPGSLGNYPSETVTVTYVNASDNYVDWANAHVLTGGDAQLLGTPAGDGVENILKYNFNLDPHSNLAPIYNPAAPVGPGGPVGLPRIEVIDEGGGVHRIEITYIRRKNAVADGFAFTGEFANALPAGPWSPFGGVELITSIDDDWEEVTLTDTASSASDPERYGRVKVQFSAE